MVITTPAPEEESDDNDSASRESREAHAEAAAGGAAGSAVRGDAHRPQTPAAPEARVSLSARPAPVASECHALGNLSDFNYSLIDPGNPEAGVELRFGGGDACLKRVVTFAPTRGAGGAKGTGAWERGRGTFEADATQTKVEWVPTPRQARSPPRLSLRTLLRSVLAIIGWAGWERAKLT